MRPKRKAVPDRSKERRDRLREQEQMQRVRDNRAEAWAHKRGMLLHISNPYTSKKSHLAQTIVPFFS